MQPVQRRGTKQGVKKEVHGVHDIKPAILQELQRIRRGDICYAFVSTENVRGVHGKGIRDRDTRQPDRVPGSLHVMHWDRRGLPISEEEQD